MRSLFPKAARFLGEWPVLASSHTTVSASSGKGAFGGESKMMVGCLYRLRDNRLVFEKAKTLGTRIDIRVDPEKAKRS
jgi:hypothetical protein